MAFLDAAGTCLILAKRDPPVNPRAENTAACFIPRNHEDHPAVLDHRRKNDHRRGGSPGSAVNGARFYFHDPDGTVLGFTI